MDIIKINSSKQIKQADPPTKNEVKVVKADIQNKVNLEDKKENKINPEDLSVAVEKANKVLFKNNSHLQFRIHEKTKDVMVKIINDDIGEVLKEIPSEKMLDMVAKLWEIAGIFVDEKR